jgi:hypothetical protein
MYLDEWADGTPIVNGIPELGPLLPTVLKLVQDPESAASISSSCSSYNNILSLGKLLPFMHINLF